MDKINRALKLIVVGSCGVGKTSLIGAYQKKQFSTDMKPTISPASYNTKIQISPEQEVTLQIWDTAGQEKYQSISQMFYRDSDICFIVYDENSVDSVEHWAEIVREEVPHVIIFLVQTKSDLLTTNTGDCVQQGQTLKKKYNFKDYFLVSSRSGQGVNEAFLAAALVYNEIFQREPIMQTIKANESKRCC